MELDKLKNILKEQNDKISENELLNKKLLRTILSGNTKSEANKLVRMILFNLTVSVVLILSLARFIIDGTIDDPILIIFSVLTFIITAGFLILAINEYRLVNQIDFANLSLLNIQKHILKLKEVIMFEKKLGFYLGPFLIMFIIPIAVKIIHGFSFFDYPIEYIVRSVIAIIIFYPIIIWFYKKFYTKPIKEIEYYLKEIDSIE